MLSAFHRLIGRIRAVFQRADFDRDLEFELEAHIQLLAEDHILRGTPREEAERLARIELGGVHQLHEAHREIRALPFLDTLRQDLRYTFRALRENPGFTAFAILIIGVGVGASSTIFSVVNTLLLRPLPLQDSRQLVWIYNLSDDGISEWSTQVGHFLDVRKQNQSFTDLAAYFAFSQPGDAKITGDGETERLSSLLVSQNFFPMLDVRPVLGRTFTADESKWNAPATAVLSYGLWKRRYASDAHILGRTITVNDHPVTIIGIAPASFDFGTVFAPGNHVDLFQPMPLTQETNSWGNTLAVIGRLKPGISIQTARAEFKILANQIQKQHPDRNTLRPILTTLEEHVTGRLRRALLVLAWAVGIVMLIVCANVANLQLARSATRQKEMAIRVALGAGRSRLIRQMLTESITLSCCGALLGIILAFAGTRLLAGLSAFNIPLLSTVTMDASSLVFCLVIAILTGLLFGLAPALQVPSISVHDTLKDTSRSSTGTKRHIWIRSTLVVSEIVFACVLLVGAGLLSRSFLNVLEVNLGFQPERAAALRIDPDARYTSQSERMSYFKQILDRVRSLPGISAAGLTDMLPLAGDRSWDITAKGKVYERGHYPEGFIRIVSDGYLQAMGIRLLAGRAFSAEDTQSSQPVAVINETLARTLWPGQNALGQIVMGQGTGGPGRQVVGIVSDVRHRALEQNSGCELYFPVSQWDESGAEYLVIRTQLPPAAIASTIRTALHPIAPELSTNEFKTLQELVDKAVSPRRFVVLLLAGFSAFALILAALGIYAVISYSVSQRSAELGIRMALGASPSELRARIMLQTLRLAGLGMLIGGITSWILARTLNSLLFGVTVTDPPTFAGMLIALAAVAGLAGYLPSLRVSRIDPMAALRAN
ncbi:MAG: ABC transporter permease [Bryobacteraceae bacterium]